MDRISVSDEGLRDAYLALQQFQEKTHAVTEACSDLLLDRRDLIDETFRKDLMEYKDLLKDLNDRVGHFVTENQNAGLERMRALAEYCSTTYTKRNI